MLVAQSLAPAELEASVGEQERIDAIVKAFQRLPEHELVRFGVDFDRTYVAGTPEAELLLEAWKLRQVELKDAMKNILQPAEHMANITRMLNGTAPELLSQPSAATIVLPDGDTAPSNTASESAAPVKQLSVEDKVYLLGQLESLLDDVDNARDFHTVGAWPTLLSFLHPYQPVPLRAAAAWAVGTAVKNTYDYQLWTLEKSTGAGPGVVAGDEGDEGNEGEDKSAVQLLVEMLAVRPMTPATGGTNDDEKSNEGGVTAAAAVHDLHKRALYALSSAMRGNLDVQDATLQVLPGGMLQSVYLNNMLSLAGRYGETPPELQRKVWASVADLIEERAFIRRELQTEAAALLSARNAKNSKGANDSGSSINNDSSEDTDSTILDANIAAVEAVQDATLLGDFLLSDHWLGAAADAASHFSTALAGRATEATPVGDDDGATGSAAASAVAHSLDQQQEVSMHAALRSILTYFKEVLQDKPQLLYSTEPSSPTSGSGTSSGRWQVKLQNVVRTIRETEHFGVSQYESLRESAEAMAALIGLLDQGANSAVF